MTCNINNCKNKQTNINENEFCLMRNQNEIHKKKQKKKIQFKNVSN